MNFHTYHRLSLTIFLEFRLNFSQQNFYIQNILLKDTCHWLWQLWAWLTSGDSDMYFCKLDVWDSEQLWVLQLARLPFVTPTTAHMSQAFFLPRVSLKQGAFTHSESASVLALLALLLSIH